MNERNKLCPRQFLRGIVTFSPVSVIYFQKVAYDTHSYNKYSIHTKISAQLINIDLISNVKVLTNKKFSRL